MSDASVREQMNQPLTMSAEREAIYRRMKDADEWTDQYLHVRELLLELDATRAALNASEQTIRERMWDENSIQCGNCSAQIMARGGSLKSNGLSQSEGEDEKLCGHCAGLQLRDSEQTIRQLRAVADKLAKALRAAEGH